MTKKTPLIIAAAIVGSLSLAAFAPAAYAQGPGNAGPRADGAHTHAQQMKRGPGGPAGFLRLMCTEKGAERMENVLGKVSEKLELSSAQQSLFAEFEKTSLTAQTEFADSCVKPPRGKDGDVVDRLKAHQSNLTATVSAMDEIIPEFEAFFDSLTDEQKAKLGKGARRGARGGPRGGNN